MAQLTIQKIAEAGLNPSYAAADAGDDNFVNDGRTFLHVQNSDAGAHTVTVTAVVGTTRKPGFGVLTKANAVVSVPAGESRMIGPFPSTAFGTNPAVSYDNVTGMTVAALRLAT